MWRACVTFRHTSFVAVAEPKLAVLATPLARKCSTRADHVTSSLKQLLEKGSRSEAWELFDGLLKRRKVNHYHASLMVAKACTSSGEQRKLMWKAEAAGVRLGIHTFTPLLARLRLEGRVDEVDTVLEEMKSRGVEPNEHTQRVLNTSEDEQGARRTSALNHMLKTDSHSEAWQMFDHLLDRGQVQPQHVNLLLGKACSNSEEQRKLMWRADGAGVALDAHTFTTLIAQLRLEGHADEVDTVLQEMQSRGIEADEHTQQVLDRPQGELDARRTSALKYLLEAGSKPEAWKMFNLLLKRGQVQSQHLGMMVARACTDSGGQWRLMQRAEAAGVVINVHTFNAYRSRLQLEGRTDELDVVQVS